MTDAKRQHANDPSRSSKLIRRTALKRSEKRLKRTPLRRVGMKGKAHRERMDLLRPTVFARALWRCEARIEDVCLGEAHHAHHVLPRSRGGADTTENLIASCHACHAWIHAHPIFAGRRGLLRGKDAQ